MQRIAHKLAIVLALLTTPAGLLRADSIYLFGPDGVPQLKPFRDNVTILRTAEKSLIFRTASGNEQPIELEKIARLTVTADPVLTEADDAYALQKYDAAVDAYQKAIRTNDAWKVQWITPRLSDAARRTKRFDAALAAYIGYARVDPPAAIANKPALPAKGSKFLDEAAKQLDAAIRASTNSTEKQALLSLLLDVQVSRGETQLADAAASQLLAISGDQTDPRIVTMINGIRLDQAAVDITAGRLAKGVELIESVGPRLSEPNQQARALFLLAQSAKASAGADKAKLIDAAVAFMRVAAHFSTVDQKPFVGESLLEAARISESLKEPDQARLLYQQLAIEFVGTPLAKEAQRALEDLK